MDFEHLKSTISFFRKKFLTDEIDEIILSPSEVRTDDIDEIILSPSKVHKIFRIIFSNFDCLLVSLFSFCMY